MLIVLITFHLLSGSTQNNPHYAGVPTALPLCVASHSQREWLQFNSTICGLSSGPFFSERTPPTVMMTVSQWVAGCDNLMVHLLLFHGGYVLPPSPEVQYNTTVLTFLSLISSTLNLLRKILFDDFY